jgi:transposase
MIAPTNWFVAVAPVDLRCGMDRLLLRVQQHYARDSFDGAAYVFRNGSGNRLKVLCVDASGVWLCVRRLHRGSFVWPRVQETLMGVSAQQFAWLVMGVDWQRLSADLASVPKQF